MDASIQNKELLGRLLRSTLGIIGRRTSDTYANIIIREAIAKLSEKYVFLKYVKINSLLYKNEAFDVVEIKDELNNIDLNEIGKAAKEFIQSITEAMGKEAGFFFIKEIKESLPYDYEKTIKEVGADLDFLQLEFLTEVKEGAYSETKHSEIIKHIVNLLFDILEKDFSRDFSYKTLDEIITRLSTSQEIFSYVKTNDIRSVQNVDFISINKDVDNLDAKDVGVSLQKLIQEVINNLDEKGGFEFIEKIKNQINPDYNMKLKDMGIDISVIKLRQELVVKHVLRSLVDVLSDSSTQSYAVMLVNNALKNYEIKYSYFKDIKIDSVKLSQGIDGVEIPTDIDSVRASELGRGLQRVIEEISTALGEEAGRFFVDKFKRRLGKAYLLRIEELGVNLHMIELRKNLTF